MSDVPGGVAGAAGSDLSDCLARWQSGGGQEFVPGGASNVSPSSVGDMGRMPVGKGMSKGRGGFMSHPMGGYPGQMMGIRMPMQWGGMPNGSPMQSAQWQAMAAAQPRMMGGGYGMPPPQSSQTQSAPQPKPSAVLAKNLDPSYTLETLENELCDIDFLPDRSEQIEKGAFVLWFDESWYAEAFVVSLDDTDGFLTPFPGEKLQIYRLPSKDLPASMQQALQAYHLAWT